MKYESIPVVACLLGSALAVPSPQQNSRDVQDASAYALDGDITLRDLLTNDNQRREEAGGRNGLSLGLDGGDIISISIDGLLDLNLRKRQKTVLSGELFKIKNTATAAATARDEAEELAAVPEHVKRGITDQLFKIVGAAGNGGRVGTLIDSLLGTLGLGGNLITDANNILAGKKGLVGGILNGLLDKGNKQAAAGSLFGSKFVSEDGAEPMSEDEVVAALKEAIDAAQAAAPESELKEQYRAMAEAAVAAPSSGAVARRSVSEEEGLSCDELHGYFSKLAKAFGVDEAVLPQIIDQIEGTYVADEEGSEAYSYTFTLPLGPVVANVPEGLCECVDTIVSIRTDLFTEAAHHG